MRPNRIAALRDATSGEDADETGIIAVGLGEDRHGYVLDDVSGRLSPTEWARQAVSLYHARQADRIVAERNNGGDLVENTISRAGISDASALCRHMYPPWGII